MMTNVTYIFNLGGMWTGNSNPPRNASREVNFGWKRKKFLKEKLKIIEDKNMEMELHVAEVIDDRKMKIDAMRSKMDAMRLKMDEMRLKIRNIRKYAIDKEAWYHYAVGLIVTLLEILIAFVVAFKCFS